MVDLKRRGVFTPLSRKKPTPIRPPYWEDNKLFDMLCPECEKKSCGIVCEEAIIKFDNRGTPFLDFTKTGCTFCEACANACPEDVLNIKHPHLIKSSVSIDTSSCLAWCGTMCFICKDVCEPNAISFFGLYRPTINQNCNGCGMCINVCLTNAIVMQGIKNEI